MTLNDYTDLGSFFENAAQDGSLASATAPLTRQEREENQIEAIFDLAHPRNIQGPQETEADKADSFLEKGTTAIDYICDTFDTLGSASKLAVRDPGELVKPEEPSKKATAPSSANSISAAGMLSGLPSAKTDAETPEQKYQRELKAYDKEKSGIEEHNRMMNWTSIGFGSLRTISGATGMFRHGKKAIEAKDRNKIVRHQSILSSISAGCSTLGGLTQASAGISGLAKNDVASGVLSIIGGLAGVAGSTFDAFGSGTAAYRYGKIANLNKANNRAYKTKDVNDPNYDGTISAADRTMNNTIFKVHDMAGLNARKQRNRNIFSSVMSGIGILGALGGLGASIADVVSVGDSNNTPEDVMRSRLKKRRMSSGILGLIASGAGILTRAVSQVADKAFDYSEGKDRKTYVENYLDSKVDKIKAQAQTGLHAQNIPGVVIDDDAAKRIVLKKLGVYKGQILGQGPFTLDDDTAKVMYNNIAMKRATKLAGLNPADMAKQQALEQLGLNKMNATAEEIAFAMGYQK